MKCGGSPNIHHDTSLDCAGPSGSAVQATIGVSQESIQSDKSDTTLFDKVKKKHDLAKAVKNDDTACPINLWNKAVWEGTPSQVGVDKG